MRVRRRREPHSLPPGKHAHSNGRDEGAKSEPAFVIHCHIFTTEGGATVTSNKVYIG